MHQNNDFLNNRLFNLEVLMLNDIKKNLIKKMDQSIDLLKEHIKSISTGRAFPELLNPVLIDYYNKKIPLFQLSNIIVDNAFTLRISAFDPSINKIICKSIIESNLGFNPSIQGDSIYVAIPHLTEERRKKLIKIVRIEAEKHRVFIRNIRREGNIKLKQYKKRSLISNDQEYKMQLEIQFLTDDYIKKVNYIADDKEKQLIKI